MTEKVKQQFMKKSSEQSSLNHKVITHNAAQISSLIPSHSTINQTKLEPSIHLQELLRTHASNSEVKNTVASFAVNAKFSTQDQQPFMQNKQSGFTMNQIKF